MKKQKNRPSPLTQTGLNPSSLEALLHSIRPDRMFRKLRVLLPLDASKFLRSMLSTAINESVMNAKLDTIVPIRAGWDFFPGSFFAENMKRKSALFKVSNLLGIHIYHTLLDCKKISSFCPIMCTISRHQAFFFFLQIFHIHEGCLLYY